APPGGPRSNPVGYYRADSGPGTVERESGKSRWRAGQARFFFWRLLWRATPPHFGGKEKTRANPKPDQTWGRRSSRCLQQRMHDFGSTFSPFASASGGPGAKLADGTTGSPLRGGERGER